MGKIYKLYEFGRFGNKWRYTLVISSAKIAGNGTKKNTPCNYHGMFNITGGDEVFPRPAGGGAVGHS
jgi:hypothetical protein